MAEVLSLLRKPLSGDMQFGMLTRFWGKRYSRETSPQMLVLMDGEELVTIHMDTGTGRVIVRTFYLSGTLGRLGREVQDETMGQLP